MTTWNQSVWDVLEQSDAEPRAFWEAVVRSLHERTDARLVGLALCFNSGTEAVVWRWATKHPAGGAWPSGWEQAAEHARTAAAGAEGSEPIAGEPLAAIKMTSLPGEPESVLLVALPAGVVPETAFAALIHAASAPRLWQLRSQSTRAQNRADRLETALDFTLTLNSESTFGAAAMRLCNEWVARFPFRRAALGWRVNEEIQLFALSETEKFTRQMERVRRLEGAMEECLDQGEEIIWPAPESAHTVTAEHRAYGQQVESPGLVSLPLWQDGEVVAVLTAEMATVDVRLSDELIDAMRVTLDLLTPRLIELEARDRPPLRRGQERLRKALGGLVGPRHVGWKLAGLVVAIVLLCLVFVQRPFRVEATVTLRTSEAAFVTAPFDGYLKEAVAEIGDYVGVGAVLARFDQTELRLQAAETSAELTRFQRELEQARAAGEAAAIAVQSARVEELRARQSALLRRLAQAEIRAPLAGYVLEGDLGEREGAPFQRGAILYRLASVEAIFVEGQLDERDIEHLTLGAPMEIILTSRPDQPFVATLREINPAAEASATGNVFGLRGEVTAEIPTWWRPGMTGVARIEVGERSLLWIATHRTVDFLRIFFWV